MSLIQNLKEGDIDIQAFSLFFNADAATEIPRRLNLPVQSLSHYEQYLEALKSVYTQTTGTVTVNGIAVKPVTVAVRDAIDAAILGDYKTQLEQQIAGIAGGRKSYKTYAEMVADKVNIPANSIIDITNDTAENNGAYNYDGTTFTKAIYDPLTQAKSYTDTAKTAAISTAAADATAKVSASEAETNLLIGAMVTPVINFGSQFTASQMTGNTVYTAACQYGFWGTTTTAIKFNKVVTSLTTQAPTTLKYRIYLGSKVSTFPSGKRATDPNVFDFEGTCSDVKSGTSGAAYSIALSAIHKIPANTDFVIMFSTADGTKLNINYFNAAGKPAELTSVGFAFYKTDVTWTQADMWALPTLSGTGFNRAGVQLTLDLRSSSAGGGTAPTPTYTDEVLLPPTVYAVTGVESNLYLKHAVSVDWTIYDYLATATSGQRGLMKNRYRIETVARPVGVTDLTLSIHDKRSHAALATAATKLTMVDPAKNTGVTKRVLVIGDSWIANNTVTQTLLDNAATNVTKIELLGTLGNAPNKHEGRSGWTVARYLTNDPANAFWNTATNSFDFGNYLTVNSIATPDVVLIQLGINDVVNALSDAAALATIATAKTQLDTMINSIHAVSPTIKVVFCVPPTQGNQDSYRTSSIPAWRAQINMFLWAKEMFAYFKGREISNTYVLGTGFNLDVENNFPLLEEPINARNPKNHFIQNNTYHAADIGYRQIGDVMFTFVKWS